MAALKPYVFTITPVWHDGSFNAYLFIEFTLYADQTYGYSEPTSPPDDVYFNINISGAETGEVIKASMESPTFGVGFLAGVVSLVYDGKTKNSVKVPLYG